MHRGGALGQRAEVLRVPQSSPFELILQLQEIQPRTTKANRPSSNGIVELFHCNLPDENFRIEGRCI